MSELNDEISEGNRLATALVDHLLRMGGAEACAIPVRDRAPGYVVRISRSTLQDDTELKIEPDAGVPAILLGVGDIVESALGHVYRVEGIFFGALDQASVVHLSPIDQSAPCAYGLVQQMFVPEEMLIFGIKAGTFKLTRAEE